MDKQHAETYIRVAARAGMRRRKERGKPGNTCERNKSSNHNRNRKQKKNMNATRIKTTNDVNTEH